VPLRIEIGPKDIEKGSVALARRDVPGREGKSFAPQTNLTQTVNLLLSEIQESMLKQATEYRDANIHDPKDYEELKEVVKDGWALSWWCGSKKCEAKVKEDTKATTRVIPFDQPAGTGKCIVCGEKAEKKVYFAKAY
jgi:prolyl-tRNA synthetase